MYNYLSCNFSFFQPFKLLVSLDTRLLFPHLKTSSHFCAFFLQWMFLSYNFEFSKLAPPTIDDGFYARIWVQRVKLNTSVLVSIFLHLIFRFDIRYRTSSIFVLLHQHEYYYVHRIIWNSGVGTAESTFPIQEYLISDMHQWWLKFGQKKFVQQKLAIVHVLFWYRSTS